MQELSFDKTFQCSVFIYHSSHFIVLDRTLGHSTQPSYSCDLASKVSLLNYLYLFTYNFACSFSASTPAYPTPLTNPCHCPPEMTPIPSTVLLCHPLFTLLPCQPSSYINPILLLSPLALNLFLAWIRFLPLPYSNVSNTLMIFYSMQPPNAPRLFFYQCPCSNNTDQDSIVKPGSTALLRNWQLHS